MAYYTSSSGQPLYSGYSSPASSQQISSTQQPLTQDQIIAKSGLNYSPAYFTPAPASGSVLGATTQQSTSQPQQQQQSGGVPSGGIPNVNGYLNEFGNWVPLTGPSQEEIDAAFNPILDVYNQAESNLKGQLPGLISEAEAQAKASQQLLGNQKTSANELLGQQEQSTNTQRQRQSAQQRQTLQELQLANQQRFGGASSAGLGASELQGREYQRSQFGIQENAQQALQQIGQKKQEVERDYQQGLQQLEVNRQQAVNEIQRKFQDRLLEINARRGETEAAKAQARMQAVQELKNQAFQIQMAKMQFEADLRSQAQSNSSYLDQIANQYAGYGQQGQQAYNQYAQTTPSGMSTVTPSTQQTNGPVPTGYMSKQEELPTGAINLLQGSNPFGLPNFQNQFQAGQAY